MAESDFGLIYIAGQVVTHVYPVRNHNDFGFFVDKCNDPDAIAFTEYNDYALCENEKQ